MSKESLDDILRSLEMHRSRNVQYEIIGYRDYFKKKVHSLVLGI